MSYRHHFIAGSIVSPLISQNYWKNFGEINFIATGTNNSLENNLHGISNSGDILFSCKLPLKSKLLAVHNTCLLYTSPSPRDATLSRMPSSA